MQNENKIDLGNYRLMTPGGEGKLAQKFLKLHGKKFQDIIIGNRTGENKNYPAYEIGELSSDFLNHPDIIGIVTVTQGGFEKAMNDLKEVPVVIATSGYTPEIITRLGVKKALLAANLVPAIVELEAIFEEQESFQGMFMEIHESHQSGKKDPSGTALRMRQIFIEKGGFCGYYGEGAYKADEGKSKMGNIYSYRGTASSGNLGVPKSYMKGHAYHDYEVSGEGENFNSFKEKIHKWSQKYYNKCASDLEILSHDNIDESILFSHNINGRAAYADGLMEVLPWFLEQNNGIYSMTDYIRQGE